MPRPIDAVRTRLRRGALVMLTAVALLPATAVGADDTTPPDTAAVDTTSSTEAAPPDTGTDPSVPDTSAPDTTEPEVTSSVPDESSTEPATSAETSSTDVGTSVPPTSAAAPTAPTTAANTTTTTTTTTTVPVAPTLMLMAVAVAPPPATCWLSIGVRANGIAGSRCLEGRLVQWGYATGPVDDRFDATSVAALRQFQSDQGLPAHGVADSPTLARLGIWKTPAAPICWVSVPVRPNASIGAKCVETRLRQLGLRTLPADNRFDGEGVRAIQQFQASVALPATGIADQATLQALKLWRQPPTSSCKVSVTVRPASSIGARCVESRLWHLGITPGTVDDYFDGLSALALARFQYAVGLPMTNIADKATLQAMGIWQDPPPNPYPVPANSGTGRRIVYSRAQQRIWAVNADGTIANTHRVSGRMYEPYAGTYHVYSRSMYTYSANNPSIRWRYMVRFAYGPGGGRIGFHEIPNRNGVPLQTYEQLGLPLSGGCVRQTTADALWIWNWAPIGTKVVVL